VASASGRAGVAAADCSKATATPLVNEHQLNAFLLPDPVVQVLCGPFTGAGSQAMAVTIGASTCWGVQRWAVFRFDGANWQLVLNEPAFLYSLVAVGNDLKETTPVFRSGDPRCVPSGGKRSRTWHWDGSRFVAGAWKQISGAARTTATFKSPGRNISCEIHDGDPKLGSSVYCQSFAHAHSVSMGLNGRLRICRSKGANHCVGDPGERTPILGYGKHVTLGHFRCLSAKAGVTCTVIKTGKGFRINRTGVQRVGG
jgi:hypothetical protein